jgi:hypothetical protein
MTSRGSLSCVFREEFFLAVWTKQERTAYEGRCCRFPSLPVVAKMGTCQNRVKSKDLIPIPSPKACRSCASRKIGWRAFPRPEGQERIIKI